MGTPIDAPYPGWFYAAHAGRFERPCYSGGGKLIRAGARGNLRNRFGRSTLDYAREQRNTSVLKILAGR